jgi:heat shock protein HtpX
MVQLAMSRKREYLADASGAEMTRYPEGLASALEKIQKQKDPKMDVNKAVSHLYFSNPFKNKAFLFSTHPPLDKRVKRLRNM